MTEGKRQKPLGLDMDLGEALERFIGVDPGELPDSIKLGKKAREKRKDGGSLGPPTDRPLRRRQDP